MPVLLASDLIDGTRIERKATGIFATRKFLIGGMRGQPLEYAFAVGGIPFVGDQFQGNAAVLCSNVSAAPAEDGMKGSPDKWFITATYEPPNENNRLPSSNGPCVIEANAVTIQKKFFQNNAGFNMYVTASINGVALPPQPFEADIPFPMTYLTFRRLEPQPFNFAGTQPFVGAVNSISWNNYAPRQALCVAIKSKDEGNACRVSYEFQCYGASLFSNQNIWDLSGVYKDPNTKAPVTENLGVIGGTMVSGVPRFRVSGEVDFNNMNLH